MRSISEQEATAALSNGSRHNAAKEPEAEKPAHRFQEGMGSHPLWQMYMEEMEALRQADIAEGNRLADLETGL